MTHNATPKQQAADTLAEQAIRAVRPQLSSVALARDLLALGDRELLHAGPPLADPRRPCIPILNAAVAAALLENWAQTPEQAREMLGSGAISLRPAQDRNCVLPLADVLSPSMWVQVVRDANAPGRWCCSPFNGGMLHPMRVGVFKPEVVDHLRWLDHVFAPAFSAALKEPIDLIPLADQGLAEGDDGHGKTIAMTRALAACLKPRLSAAEASTCLSYLEQSPGFFLNLWMAACRCMLSAATGTKGSGVVTAAGGNGEAFGIQVAGLPGRWFTGPAVAPAIAQATPELTASSLGAIGDSALVDLLGFGAMTTLGIPRSPAAFLAAWPLEADTPNALLGHAHPGFALTRPRLTVNTRRVLSSGRQPLISLGVLDKAGQRGRLDAGYFRVPLELFSDAEESLTHAP